MKKTEKKDAVKVVEKKGAVKVEKKVEVKKDSNGLSDRQETALKLIQKGVDRAAFLKALGIELGQYGGVVGNLKKRGYMIEVDKKSGKLSLSK